MLDGDSDIWKVPEILVGSTSTVRSRVKRLTQHAIKLKSWDLVLKQLPTIDVRHTEIQIATSAEHHIMTLIPYVSFNAIAQGIGEGCSHPNRLLALEFTKQVILDGLSHFWIVFGVCESPQAWDNGLDSVSVNQELKDAVILAVFPSLIRAAVKWREEMDWLEKRAKEKAVVDIGSTWSNALKIWIWKLEPVWNPNDWNTLDSEVRCRLVIEKLETLRL
jgi:hypothetical protein